jgi:hypothetical protein
MQLTTINQSISYSPSLPHQCNVGPIDDADAGYSLIHEKYDDDSDDDHDCVDVDEEDDDDDDDDDDGIVSLYLYSSYNYLLVNYHTHVIFFYIKR